MIVARSVGILSSSRNFLVVASAVFATALPVCSIAPLRGSRRVKARVAKMSPGEPGEQGGDAPDGDPDADHRLAGATVAPQPEGNCGEGIDEEEGAAQESDGGVGDVELFLDGGGDGCREVAVHVVEEVDPDHHGEYV